jgi:hypothetical protein
MMGISSHNAHSLSLSEFQFGVRSIFVFLWLCSLPFFVCADVLFPSTARSITPVIILLSFSCFYAYLPSLKTLCCSV